jgi:hypothetical protein
MVVVHVRRKDRAAKHGDKSWESLDLIGKGQTLILHVLSSSFFVTLAEALDSCYNLGIGKGSKKGAVRTLGNPH